MKSCDLFQIYQEEPDISGSFYCQQIIRITCKADNLALSIIERKFLPVLAIGKARSDILHLTENAAQHGVMRALQIHTNSEQAGKAGGQNEL